MDSNSFLQQQHQQQANITQPQQNDNPLMNNMPKSKEELQLRLLVSDVYSASFMIIFSTSEFLLTKYLINPEMADFEK